MRYDAWFDFSLNVRYITSCVKYILKKVGHFMSSVTGKEWLEFENSANFNILSPNRVRIELTKGSECYLDFLEDGTLLYKGNATSFKYLMKKLFNIDTELKPDNYYIRQHEGNTVIGILEAKHTTKKKDNGAKILEGIFTQLYKYRTLRDTINESSYSNIILHWNIIVNQNFMNNPRIKPAINRMNKYASGVFNLVATDGNDMDLRKIDKVLDQKLTKQYSAETDLYGARTYPRKGKLSATKLQLDVLLPLRLKGINEFKYKNVVFNITDNYQLELNNNCYSNILELNKAVFHISRHNSKSIKEISQVKVNGVWVSTRSVLG